MQSQQQQPVMGRPSGLVVSDLHIGGKWDRLDRTDDIFKILDGIVQKAVDEGHRFIINLGDTFHNNSPTPRHNAAVIGFYHKLEKLGIQSITLEGNHDHRGRSEKGSAIEPFYEIDFKHAQYVSAIACIKYMTFDGIKYPFLCIPHLPDHALEVNLGAIAKMLEQDPGGVHPIGLCHLDVDGAEVGAERHVLRHRPATLPTQLLNHPQIAFWLGGHIHRPQNIHATRMCIVGSILQHDFGEVGEQKRCIELKLNPPEITRTFSLPHPLLKKLDLDFTDPSRAEQSQTVYDLVMGCEFGNLDISSGDIVKVDVRITDEQYSTKDFPKFEANLNNHCRLVKKLSPTIVRSRDYRMKELSDLKTDEEIVSDYLNARARGDVDVLKTMALEVVEEVKNG